MEFGVNKVNINPKAEDCYYFFYRTCARGDKCLFRHCSAALGNEEVCALWKAGKCTRQVCAFRHSTPNRQRNVIECYYEKLPSGCTKPHCAYKHSKPRSNAPSLEDRVKLCWEIGAQEKMDAIKIKSLSKIQSEKAGDAVSHSPVPPAQASVFLRSNSESRERDKESNVQKPTVSHSARANAPVIAEFSLDLFSGSRSNDSSSIFCPTYRRPSVPAESSATLPSKRSKGKEVMSASLEASPLLPVKKMKSDSDDDHVLNMFSFAVPNVSPTSVPRKATSPVDSFPSSSPIPTQPHHGSKTSAIPKAPAKRKRIVIIKRRKRPASRAADSSVAKMPKSPCPDSGDVSLGEKLSSSVNSSFRTVSMDGPTSPIKPSFAIVGIATPTSGKPASDSPSDSRVATVVAAKPNSDPIITTASAQPVREHSDSSATTTLSDIPVPDHYDEPCENKCLETDAVSNNVDSMSSDAVVVKMKQTNETESLLQICSASKEAKESHMHEPKEDQDTSPKPSFAEVRAEIESELAEVAKRRESDLLYDPDDELNELMKLDEDDPASLSDLLADSHNDDDLLLELEDY